MGRSSITVALCLFFLFCMLLEAPSSAEDRANKSYTGGILWANSMEKSDILAAIDSDEEYSVGGDSSDELAGGFSSLEGMLQWAIGHSDPEKLKEKANDAQRLSHSELSKRQIEIKELMEKLKMTSDTELMKIAINDLNNSSISLEDRQRALNELLILVEPIDNANDLDKLGGLVAVVQELNNPVPDIRTTSAWILGKASQNNVLVQNQILALGPLTMLIKMAKSSYSEEAIKALFAISALIRNSVYGQDLFFSKNGSLMLQDIMSNATIDIRLQKKALILVTDLADYQQVSVNAAKHTAISDCLILKAVVELALSDDFDLKEKALIAIKSLLQLSLTMAADLNDLCPFDQALEKIARQIEDMSLEHFDYAEEMKGLVAEISLIFHGKSSKASTSWVPT